MRSLMLLAGEGTYPMYIRDAMKQGWRFPEILFLGDMPVPHLRDCPGCGSRIHQAFDPGGQELWMDLVEECKVGRHHCVGAERATPL